MGRIRIRQFRYLLLGMLLVIVLSATVYGSLIKPVSFDDTDIKITIEGYEVTEKARMLTLKLRNTSNSTLKHNVLLIGFTVNQSSNNTSVINGLKVEAKADGRNQDLIRPGQEVVFRAYYPLEVTLRSGAYLDMDRPQIQLTGFVLDGNDEIPYHKSGDLEYFK